MAARAGINKEYTKNFHLDETKLRRIAEVLREHGAKVGHGIKLSFYVRRENDSFYETDDIEDILADENTPGKSIQVTAFYLKKIPDDDTPIESSLIPKSEAIAFVGFSLTKNERVLFSVNERERDWCFLLADELDTQITRTLHGHRWSFNRPFILDLIIVIGLGTLSLVGISWWLTSTAFLPIPTFAEIAGMTTEESVKMLLKRNIKNREGFNLFLPGMMATILLMVLGLEFRPFSRMVKAMERSCFYWGDSVSIYDKTIRLVTRIKWGIGIGLLVTIVGGLFVAWVSG